MKFSSLLHHPADLRGRPLAADRRRRRAGALPAADQRIPGRRAADGRRARAPIPGANPKVIAETVASPLEQQMNGVEGMLYMFSQATVRRRADADHHLRARHRSRQRAGAGAEPRRPGAAAAAAGSAAHRRHHREGVARLHDGRAPRLAGRALRHALPVELRAPAGARTRSTRIAGVGAVQVFGAGEYSMRVWLDPGPAGVAAADGHRRRAGHPRAERPGGGRRARRAAGAVRHHVPALDQHAGPADHRKTSSATSSSARPPTGRSPGCRTSPASSSARAATRCAACSTTSRRWRSASSSGPAPTRSQASTDVHATMERLKQNVPAGRRLPHRLRPDGVRPRVDQRGRRDAVRGDPAGRDRGGRLPADLARVDHPAGRGAGVAGRHVRGDARRSASR